VVYCIVKNNENNKNPNDYSEKVYSFLSANNFKTLTKDPADKFQKTIHKTMQECNLIIDKRQIKQLTEEARST
jgi:hypothetical protein